MGDNTSILVVDDDPSMRKTLSDILRVKGFEVATADSGAAGIAAAKSIRPGVLLVDLKLPDMSGIEVMQRIKADTPLTEAIILTGHASLETAVEATNKGAFSYLLKPYQIEDLLQHLRRALERQKAQQEILRLASFPGMNPNPVLEIDDAGVLTYLNPAAAKILPGLALSQPVGDALGDLAQCCDSGERRELVRELAVDAAVFEQHLYPVAGSDRTRIYLMDISARKAHESNLKRANQLLLAVRNINEQLLVAESEEALYRFVCEALQEVEDVVGVVIVIKQPDYVLQPVAWGGFDEQTLAGLNIRWDDSGNGGGAMGCAVREGRLVAADEVEHDPHFRPWLEVVRAWHIRSAAAVPLVVDGEIMGALGIYSGRKGAMDEQTRDFLSEVGGDIAIGVRTLRLDQNLHATLDHLRSSMNSTVEAIARMVELRDPYTAGHERRVAQLACAIGVAMGLPERQVEGLRVIGHLHDIGKIAVPAEIMSKPSKLLDMEFALVQAHARSGYEILKGLEFPWPVAQAVLQHHERMDGSGYPQGLRGEDIILEARIIMVADVVEAMSNHRPYRSAIGVEQALAEINANCGRLYDERVVVACNALFSGKGFKFQ